MQQNTGIEVSKEDKDSLVKDMLNKFKDGSLSSVYLKEYWNLWLNKSLPVDWITNINCGLMESIAEKHLEILEDFIFNESKEILLKREDMCRKVFKLNDFYFSCFDCRSGKRRVMCTNCFMNSTHRFHKYEFGISNEEGLFCDCGIHDAWKCNPYCEEHSKTASTQFELPLDVASRASFVIESVVKYCVEIWCQDPLPSIPIITEDSEKDVNRNLFCTVLLKNSKYCDSKVPNELFEAIADSNQFTANIMAGRGMFIICDSLPVCCTTKNKLDSLIKIRQLPLRSYICHWHQLAQQAFSFELLSWLPKLVLKDVKLREVFLSVVLNNTSQCLDLINGSNKDSFLDIIILNRPSMLWNAAKSVWYNIIVTCILTDYKNKCVFAKIFIKHYAFIMKDCDLSIHGAPYVGLNTISEHVFAVPSIAKQLVEDENALAILFDIFKTTYSTISSATCYYGYDDITRNKLKNVVNDIGLMLDFKPDNWSCKLRENFIQGINVYLNVLVFLQKIYSLKLLETFEFFYYLKALLGRDKQLLTIDTKIVQLCSTNEALLIDVYKLTLKTISEDLIPCLGRIRFKKLAGHCAQLFSYNSSDEDVQFVCPILRFFASLYQELQKKSLDYRSPKFTFIIKPTPEQLVDAILKMGVSVVKRNCFISRQTHKFTLLINFFTKDFAEILSKEIFVLQIGATLIENNTFLITLLNKFELLRWASEEFESDTTIEGTQETNKDTMEKSVSLGEDFLLLIIYIIGERYNTEISTVTRYECSKYKIFHSLSVCPKRYTQLVNEFPDLGEDEINSVLGDVATIKPCEIGLHQELHFVANKDLRDSYNKYYCYYMAPEKDISNDEQKKLRKLLDGIDCCPPPQLCKVKPYYQSLTTLLHCDVMLNIIRAVLNRSLYPRHKGSSKEQLLMTLHLIGYGLWEEENGHGVSFTDNALKWNIETLLERLNCSLHTEYCKDLIQWTLNKFKSVKNKNKPTVVSTEESSKCSEIVERHYEDDSGRSQRASKRRATIMDKMRSLQDSFFKNNSHAFEELFEKENRSEESVKTWKCICCLMDDDTSNSESALVLAAFVERSRLLAKNQDMLTNWFPTVTGDYHSAYVKSCGHAMHIHCLERYLQTLRYNQHHLDLHEFLCPLCKCTCNTKIPIVSQSYYEDCEISFDLWLQKIKAFCGDPKVPMQYDDSFTTGLDNTSKLLADDSKTKEVAVFPTLNEVVTNENPELSEELIKTLTSFILRLSECYKISSPGKDFLLVWQVCAYKICCLERYKFSMGTSLLGNISYAEESCIENLVNISSMLGIIYQNTLSGSTVIREILFLLFSRGKVRKTNILKWECFELFFYLNMALAGCNKLSRLKIHFDKNLFRVILVLNFAKIILNSNISEFINLDFDSVSDDTRCLVKFVKLFKDCKGINSVELWNFIKESSLPFLNSSCIFYYFLTGQKPSKSLEKVGGNTFENVLNYIGLSFGCNELLNSDFIFETISSVAEHPDVQAQRENISLSNDIVRFKTLFPLPENFYEIIFMAEKYVCPHSNMEHRLKRSKCLCLICGQIFCCYNNIINGRVVRGYDKHGIVCPWETGLFLNIYSGEVNLVSSYFKDPFECSIQLYTNKERVKDKFGGRSNPLYLINDFYSMMNKWWLSHSLIEEIRRKIRTAESH